jgi:hypothetical protein
MKILKQENRKLKKSKRNGSKEPKRKNGVRNKIKLCLKISKINSKPKLLKKSLLSLKALKIKLNTPKSKKSSKMINLIPKSISFSFKG